MLDRVLPILAFVFLIVLGFIKQLYENYKIQESINYTIRYNNEFIELCNGILKNGNLNQEKYNFCMKNIDTMQIELGVAGVMGEIIDPLKGIKMSNYPILLNTLPEIKNYSFSELRENSIMTERIMQSITMCTDAFTRHLGMLDRQKENSKKGMRNPIMCFAEGIKMIISFPLYLLLWCGIISDEKVKVTLTSLGYRIITKVVSLIGIVSSIMTIALGWKEFGDLIEKILKNF